MKKKQQQQQQQLGPLFLRYLSYHNKRININFKLTRQLFKEMFRHDSCYHQFNVSFCFPLFKYVYNLSTLIIWNDTTMNSVSCASIM